MKKLQINKFNFISSILNNKQIIVNVNNKTKYIKITNLINEAKLEWHTYEYKINQTIIVLTRDLYPLVMLEQLIKYCQTMIKKQYL